MAMTLPDIEVVVQFVSLKRIRWKTWRLTIAATVLPFGKPHRVVYVVKGAHGAEVRRSVAEWFAACATAGKVVA